MYQTRIKGEGLYQASVEGYGKGLQLFGQTQDGETPMSLVNVALSSCITMCVQGYFARYQQKDQLELTVDSDYEPDKFQLTIHLAEPLSDGEQEKLLVYIDQHCRVKKLLRPDVEVVIKLT